MYFYLQCLQLGNPNMSSSHSSHFSPITLLRHLWHTPFPSQVDRIDPSVLHSQALNIENQYIYVFLWNTIERWLTFARRISKFVITINAFPFVIKLYGFVNATKIIKVTLHTVDTLTQAICPLVSRFSFKILCLSKDNFGWTMNWVRQRTVFHT